MSDFTFPQDHGTGAYPQNEGDANDAANFGSLIGATQPVSVIVRGLGFSNVDFTNLTFDVDSGKAYLVGDGITSASSGEDRDKVGMVNELDERVGFSLTDNTVNHVYVATDLNSNDSPYIEVNGSETNPEDPSVKIGEIDTTNETTSEQWSLAAPDGTITFPQKSVASNVASSLGDGAVVYSRSDEKHYSVVAGSLKPMGAFTDPDGDGVYQLPSDTDGIDVASVSADALEAGGFNFIGEFQTLSDFDAAASSGDRGYITDEQQFARQS